jgi:hypothetical protein
MLTGFCLKTPLGLSPGWLLARFAHLIIRKRAKQWLCYEYFCRWSLLSEDCTNSIVETFERQSRFCHAENDLYRIILEIGAET